MGGRIPSMSMHSKMHVVLEEVNNAMLIQRKNVDLMVMCATVTCFKLCT